MCFLLRFASPIRLHRPTGRALFRLAGKTRYNFHILFNSEYLKKAARQIQIATEENRLGRIFMCVGVNRYNFR